MRKLYYLTRSYLPTQTGGTLIRAGAVELLKKYFQVTVITTNNGEMIKIDEDVIRIPVGRLSLRSCMVLERIGLLEDYLDSWVRNVIQFLSDKINEGDILFATSGGELACLKIASKIKKLFNCSYVANFHDPIDYSLVNEVKVNKVFHVSREKVEAECFSNVDLMITSTNIYANYLQKKYPDKENRITSNYFGYIESCELDYEKSRSIKKPLNVVYSGNMSSLQKPELLLNIAGGMANVNLIYIGDYQSNRRLQKKILKFKNVVLREKMTHEKYLGYMQKEADIGFLSLSSEYLGACIPAKLYEYINLSIPILGILPDGDAKDIINDNGYGFASSLNDINHLKDFLASMLVIDNYNSIKRNLLRDHKKWAMEYKILEIVPLLQNI